MRKLTIIITASYVPSHPDTRHIDGVMDSLKLLNYPEDTRIILAHDYPHDSSTLSAYFEYYGKLNFKYGDTCIITMLDRHKHLTGSIRNAFKYVDSEYVLLVQHDFPFIKNVDLTSVMNDMDNNPQLKHVRFNKRNTIQTAGDWLTADRELNVFNTFSIRGVNNYVSTFCWSDNNHISPSSYYRDIVLAEVRDGMPMENHLYQELRKIAENKNATSQDIEQAFKKYGNFIYGELNEEAYLYHSDGRNDRPD